MSINVGDRLPKAILGQGDARKGRSRSTAKTISAAARSLSSRFPAPSRRPARPVICPASSSKADELKAKGVDEVACIAVNDAFVLQAWAESSDADGKVTMLADGNGDFAQALGLTIDGSKFGMGAARLSAGRRSSTTAWSSSSTSRSPAPSTSAAPIIMIERL